MEQAGLTGFGVATFSYLTFFALLIASPQKTFSSKLLSKLILALCLLNFCSALQIYLGFSLLWVLIAECIKLLVVGFLIFSIRYGINSFNALIKQNKIKSFALYTTIGIGGFLLAVFYFYQYSYVFIGLLVFNLYILALLEQLFRNASEKVRWSLWPFVIAIGTLSVFDFILFAQGALLNNLNFDFWYARGFISCMAIPLFVLSSKRIQNLDGGLFISRDMVFYSSILIIAGAYLLILAFAGYIISYLQVEWSGILSVLFLAVGFLVFIVLMLTSSFRRKLKVFIGKHFFSNKYEYRDEWLKVTKAIEKSHHKDVVENLCGVMASSIGVNDCGFARVSASLHVELIHKSELSISDSVVRQLPEVSQFCQQSHWIIDCKEYRRKPENYQGLVFDAELFLSNNLQLIIPVFNLEHLFGLFILPCRHEEGEINWEDRDFLFAVAKQVANYLFLKQAQEELAQSQQFNMFHRMSAFVVHDLKNIQAQLALLHTNAAKHRDNPEFIDDVFDTVKSADDRLNKVILQLRNKALKVSSQDVEPVNLKQLLLDVKRVRDQQHPPVDVHCAQDHEIRIEKDPFYSVLMHLVQNAQDACNGNGCVELTAEVTQNANNDLCSIITIQDNGCGMDSEFIKNRLFKPFESTKGNSGMGIGAFEAKQFIEGQQGQLTVKSELNKGSTFTISLPK